MTSFKLCLTFAALLAAGCAATPEAPTASGEPAGNAASAGATEVARTVALDARELDTSAVVTCRDELKLGSNVIVTRCMTAEDWERYERFQTRQAQEMLRVMQGSAYR